jgi:histidyl-tRNA synthetase
MNKVQVLKGFRDFLPEQAKKRQWLTAKFIEAFEAWGYQPLETPTLEPLEIFKGEIGEDEKLFFKFKDLGGREVALRYDQTVPTCRVIGQYINQLVLPFRRYQIQPAYRAEKPQKGRYREFVQADIDIFGVKSPLADAETIAVSLDVYRRIGFKNVIALVNNRDLMKNIPYKALVAIDKLEKIGQDGVIEDMVKKGIDKTKAQEYLEFVKNLQPDETIKIIFAYLKNSGFPESCYKFQPTLTRSFSYSQGPIWEIVLPEYTAGSVGGGERYDDMVKRITGLDIPATGIAFGFDRTLEAAEQQNLIPDLKINSQVLVTVFAEKYLVNSLTVASKLRERVIKIEIYPDTDTKLDKQLKYADRKGIPYVVIVGPDEVKQGKVTLKNLKTKTQETVSLEEAVNKL